MTSNSDSTQTLLRGLGLAAAVSIIIGNVIGTGVFLKARVMTCNVGTPGWVIAAWIAAGLLSLAGALTYAELTAMKPQAGGEYVFLRDAYGKLSSFLFGWTQMFIIKPGSQAAAGMAFAIGLNDFIGNGSLGSAVFLKTTVFSYPIEFSMIQVVALMAILIFTTLNAATVSISGQIATVLTGIKIALIVFVGVGAFIWVTGDFAHFSMINDGGTCEKVADSARYGSATYSFAAGFGAAMLGALWGYDGWNNLGFVAGEVKEPGRNIPLAIIGSTILIILLYLFVHIGYFYVLDPTAIASVSASSSVAKTVVSMFFGGGTSFAAGIAVALFTVGLMMSSLGTLHTSILSGSRVAYAMAQDKMMVSSLGKLSITRVPVRALIFQGIIASILALSGSFDTLTDYVVFGSWIFYALVTSSIFIFRKRYPDAERPYRAWGYPVVPVLFLLVAGWLLINTFYTALPEMLDGISIALNGRFFSGIWKTITAGPLAGILLIILGLPVYYYLVNRGSVEQEKTTDD
ncbi:MAG TPA: amino acid permease [Pyrinomonadaceae bacterium]|nr:amino acid permease [Pyrinomonadaceae bacterium]